MASTCQDVDVGTSDCKPEPGRVDASGLAFKGSQLQMQLYANRHREALEVEAWRVGAVPDGVSLDWISPIEADGYVEYRDTEFLDRLSLSNHSPALRDFWPKGGPCWDGLARWSKNEESGVLLFEAKSYPKESKSRLMARAEPSNQRIGRALTVTATWLGLAATPRTWTSELYQTANRLAHLYFLRELCAVNAELVFLLVVEDPTHRRTTRDAWQAAWSLMWTRMALAGAPPNTHALLLPGLVK